VGVHAAMPWPSSHTATPQARQVGVPRGEVGVVRKKPAAQAVQLPWFDGSAWRGISGARALGGAWSIIISSGRHNTKPRGRPSARRAILL
jgi:hypothetical protein